MVKYFDDLAGTYGYVSNVRGAALFNDYINSGASSTPGWLNMGESSYIGQGGAVLILNETSGAGPSTTPIPAALPLFGSGLVLLVVLRKLQNRNYFNCSNTFLQKEGRK
jgi:hypothetical protein